MKILYYDCFSGISGDMNLAAMLSLGVDRDFLEKELGRLGIGHDFRLKADADSRRGIHGIRVDVLVDGNEHQHRNLKDIEAIVSSSRLSEKVKETSLLMFRRLAEAEAKVHGRGIYEVHFHEVGAIDSIVDIVGAAICYHCLDVDAVWCSPVELGGGFVHCAHGMMPVPAPATVEILSGIPTTRGAVQAETTTPTGAVILSALTDKFVDSPRMTVLQTGYGIGHRDSHLPTDIPNVLRVHLARVEDRVAETKIPEKISARLLECNIDDMTPEMLGVVMDELMDAGAMDVSFTPIVMKKSRPAVTLSLLCASSDEDLFRQLLFEHTTTLGIKSIVIEKSFLETVFEKIETPLGLVTMKNAMLNGRVIRSKPELEECRKLAHKHNISLAQVYLQIGRVRNI